VHQSNSELLLLVLFISISFFGLAVFFIKLVYTNNIGNANRQTELYKSMMLAQERERERLAKDLHDSLGPKLSFLRLENDLLSKADTPETFRQRASNSAQLISEVQTELRDVSHNLIPRDLENYGLAYEIDKLQYKVQSAGSTIFLSTTSGLKDRFTPDVELNLFRIIQELINNTLRHSGANEINLSIEKNDRILTIHYRDNGKGFNQEENLLSKKGIGLENMHTRINLYHGRLKLNSSPGKGIYYIITFPLQHIQIG
jgi:signal transduction histidine kinase